MVVSLITKSFDIFRDHKKSKEAIDAARDRIVDEVKITLSELDKYLAAERKIASSEATRAMKRRKALSLAMPTLEKVSDGNIPFSVIFPEKLDHTISFKVNDEGKIRQYRRWIEKDQAAADLIRRVRIRITKIQRSAKDGEDPGDLGYLHFQLRTFLKSLSKSK